LYNKFENFSCKKPEEIPTGKNGITAAWSPQVMAKIWGVDADFGPQLSIKITLKPKLLSCAEGQVDHKFKEKLHNTELINQFD